MKDALNTSASNWGTLSLLTAGLVCGTWACQPKEADRTSVASSADAQSQTDPGARPWAIVNLEVVDGVFAKPKTSFGEHLSLPQSWAYDAMTPGVAIVMTTSEIIFDGHAVVPLKDNRVVPEALDEYLIRDLKPLLENALIQSQQNLSDKENRHAILFADAGVQVGSLIPLLYTSGAAGFASYEFAIDVGVREGTELPVGMVLPFIPPRAGGYDKGLNAFIDRERVVLWLETMPEWTLNLTFDTKSEDDIGQLAMLGRSKTQALAQLGAFPTLTFSAENDVTIGRLVAVLSALRGPECEPNSLEDRSKCFFPVAVIEAGNVPPKADFGPPLATVAQCRSIARRAGPRGVGKADHADQQEQQLSAAGRMFFNMCIEAIHQPDVACYDRATDKQAFDQCTQKAMARGFAP